MNMGLIEELYSKHMFKDKQGIKSDWKSILSDYTEITGEELVFDTVRKKVTPETRERLWEAHYEAGNPTLPPTELEIGGDGSRKLLAYKEMSVEDSKDPEEVMRLNGYDPNEWDLIRLKVSEWTMGVENQNYSIGLEVRPKDKGELTVEEINALIDTTSIEPMIIEPTHKTGNNLLLIPLTDMHMGIADYGYYKPHQSEIYGLIISHTWEEIVFTIGSDLFHNDNFRGNTSSGTPIEAVDMEKAWDDTMKFYRPLLEAAQRQSQKVRIMYIKGNHDETISWAFVRALDAIYTNIKVDTKFEEAKCIVYRGSAIAITHGDKANDKRITDAMRDIFEEEMVGRSKYVIRGHIHTQKMQQLGGMSLYALGTAAKTDQWHQDKMFVGNQKQFELFVFNDYSLKNHMFIDGRG